MEHSKQAYLGTNRSQKQHILRWTRIKPSQFNRAGKNGLYSIFIEENIRLVDKDNIKLGAERIKHSYATYDHNLLRKGGFNTFTDHDQLHYKC